MLPDCCEHEASGHETLRDLGGERLLKNALTILSSWYNPDALKIVVIILSVVACNKRSSRVHISSCTSERRLFPGYNFRCTRYGIHQVSRQGPVLFRKLPVTAVVFNSCVTLSSSLCIFPDPV
jgi:hypothetical protein